MAIIQISKIQARSGNLVDLPQLDEGEFGWASDTKRLFIGKTTPNENIEVLTSYTNINFNQLDGSGDTQLNITNPGEGEILGIQPIGSTYYIVNRGGTDVNSPGGLVNLGDVSNVKIGGGAANTSLVSDGMGGMKWLAYTGVPVGGNTTEVQYNNLGIFAGSPNFTFDETTNTLFATNLTGTTVSISGEVSLGNIVTTDISTGSNVTPGNITGNWSLTSGSRLQATYADLAEYYEADAEYEPGTVVEFGGEKEVTIAQDGTTRVAGVVTTNPAYVMNTGCPGTAVAIALQGRVPCKVRGKVHKGDLMVSAGNGYARPWNNAQPGMIIGKAIENFEGTQGIIEIAVGRL